MKADYDRHKMLWSKFLEGDDKDIEALYNEFVNPLFTFGMCFSFNEEMVKDGIQDLFAKLIYCRKRLKPVENVRIYLYSALKNILYNSYKKEARYYQIDTIEPVFYTEFTPETRLIESERLYEQKKCIARMMESITPRQREILYYRFIEELSYEEICQLMQMNYQSVRNLLHRTLQKLRSMNQ
ncbi:MAG: sigma-70 family RNA polymerase sigma factor [Tannerella sp.]|jgi:RNA polymerase sigma factor (sigma-70 family)|nr:sigma-70 family RNA polymerase sigma factor [Tannerella sp.]